MPTSFQQNVKFSPKPEEVLDEFRFDGGLITDSNETKLQPNQSPNMYNLVFDPTGTLKTRNGYSKYNTTSLGNNPITGLIRFYGDAGLEQTIAKYTTSLYWGNDGTGALTAFTLGSGASLASTTIIDWTVTNGTLLVVDGQNYIQKYRGSTNANYSTGTLTATLDSAVITGSGTTWATSTNAIAGQYIKLPDGKWYKIITIASNTSLTVETNYTGATLAGQTYVISSWGEVQGKLDTTTAPAGLVRPTPSYIENHANRIWTLEGNNLKFSALDTSVGGEHFNDWDSANNSGSINLPSSKDTDTTGLKSFNGSLYIFQRQAVWRLSGNSPANFELKNVSNEVGLTNNQTLVEWGNLLIFLSNQGVVVFDGSNIRNISERKINELIDSWSNRTSPAAVLWDNKYLLTYTPSGGSANTQAVFCDLTQGDQAAGVGLSVGSRWGKFINLPGNVFSVHSGGTENGEVYFGSSSLGRVYLWDNGITDDGTDIESLYDTPSLGFDKNVADKTLKKFYLQQIATGSWNMLARLYTDINAGPTSVNISLSPGSVSLWDVALWDVDSWSAEGEIVTTRIAEFQGLAKYYKFRFEASDAIELLGLTATVRARRI